MIFDLIISNPPFTNNVDLNILKEIYQLGNRICFVHPTTWLFTKKPNNDVGYIKKFIANDFSYFEVVKESNRLFRIELFMPCSINLFHKNFCNVNINDLDVHGDSEIYKSIKNKILKYCKYSNLEIKKKRNHKLDWEVGVSSIRGHPMPSADTYTLLQKVKPHEHIGKCGTVKYWQKFGFATKNEADNFMNFLMLKLTRFCLSIYKINQHQDSGELAAVPYLPTYEHKWTNELFAEELDLTNEELNWCINWIPNYYENDEND